MEKFYQYLGAKKIVDSERKISSFPRRLNRKKKRRINDLEERAALSTGNGKQAEEKKGLEIERLLSLELDRFLPASMDAVLSGLLDRSCSRRAICCELFVTCRPRRDRNQAVKRATSRAACVPCDPGNPLRKLILMDWKLCPFHLSCASFQTAWLILLARSFQRLPCNTWINVAFVCLFSSFFFFHYVSLVMK